MRRSIAGIVLITLTALGQWGEAHAAGIRAAKPTHYFRTPAPYVNPPWHLTVSLHEISYALPQRLQFQVSLLDAVGRLKAGVKFGLSENLSVGVGLSSYWGQMWYHENAWYHPRLDGPYYRYYYPHDVWPVRVGAFLSVGRGRGSSFEWSLTPNLQLGDPIGMGCDFGLMATPSEWWSIIAEMGGSIQVDFNDHPWGEFFTTGGVRVHPPTIPFLSFDGGLGMVVYGSTPGLTAHFDVIFAMITR